MKWRNSNFQYLHFILGACHTPIEAHRKCCEAIEDRLRAMDENTSIRKHWLTPIKALWNPKSSKWAKQNAQEHIDQAQAEVKFLTMCKDRLEAAIGHVPTMDDYQQNQCDEWRLELEHRAENYLLCTGSVPPEHFVTMRMHPEFPKIEARIQQVAGFVKAGGNYPMIQDEWKKNILSIENKGGESCSQE